jgi:SNF2 family DNA or RNA helicase
MLPSDGGPARFEVGGQSDDRPYLVTLRGPNADRPSCTCPDFMKSELERCKHGERARAWYLRKKKNISTDVLSVWWSPRVWIDSVPRPLCEIRVDAPEDCKSQELLGHLDESGYLAGGGDDKELHKRAESLLKTARELCESKDWRLDLDPGVERELQQSAEALASRERLEKIDADAEVWTSTIENLGFNLHEYQVEGALFTARTGRSFLADDMGLGKTIQAIVGALLLRKSVGARRAMVVCPASLKHQWRREIRKACGEQAVVIEGRRVLRLEQYKSWTSGFLVINYELVLRDLEEIREAAPELVILDEAQRIKNWDTKTAKAIKALDSPYAFILTGTPLENRLGELHSLVEFLYPRALGPRWRLRPFHAITDSQGRDVAYEGLDVLRSRLTKFFLRRERSEVLDQLPDRTDNTFWIQMTGAQRRPYRRYASKVASILSNSSSLAAGEVRALLQSLTSMRILCNSLAQHDWASYSDRVLSGEAARRSEIRQLYSPKLEEFESVLEDLLDSNDSKIVVFSQWERMLRLAHFVTRGLLDSRDERAEVFHGGLSSKRRDEILNEFQNDDTLKVLFSTDAGGQGLNLQASASIVVNLEVPWNPAVLEQRIGRVHRIGQRNSVQVLHFVTQGAIEERVRQVVEGKRALFEGLLVNDADKVDLSARDRTSLVDQVRDLVEDERRKAETFDPDQSFQ